MRRSPEATRARRPQAAVLAAASLLALLAAGCDSRVRVEGPRLNLPTVPTQPSGPAATTVTESRPIAGVNGVRHEAVGHAYIAVSGAESLTVSAPESIIGQLTSEVVAGRLVLGREFGSYQGQASDIQYDITLRQLDELELEGVGLLAATGVDTGLFRVDLGGVGEIQAAGRADRQEVRVAGTGSYVAPTLVSRVARVDLSGGKATIYASERIEGWVGFGCTLEYWGDPELDIRGGGRVERLGLKP